MERRVNFIDGMDLSPDDFSNIQLFAQQSFDHVVGDGITASRRYAGFATGQTGALTISAEPGRLYAEGKVYVRDTAFPYDFTAMLPVQDRKVCTLVTFGETVQTAETPREILIDVDNLTTEPQLVAMETVRIARLAIVQGAESPDPSAPVIAAGYTAIANVVLSTTGIDSVAMIDANKLDSVASLAARAAQLEGFRDSADPKIAGLAGDIAALTEGQRRLVGTEQYSRVLTRLAQLEAGKGVPTAAVDSFADLLLDDGASDPAFAGYAARVSEGIRLPAAASATTALSLKNPLDPNARVVGGRLLPAYDRVKQLSTGTPTGEVKLNSFSYSAHDLLHKTDARFRLRYGPWWAPSYNYAYLKNFGVDLLPLIFAYDGEAIVPDALLSEQLLYDYNYARRPGYWYDWVENTYWDYFPATSTVNGTQVAETFLQANDMVLEAIGLPFTRLANDGDVTVAICETDHGVARLDRVIAKVTVPRNQLQIGAETMIPLQPTLLTGGVRYALVIITAADHYLGTVAGQTYPQGTFFYVLDGQYQQGDGTRDLAFSLYAAKFRQSRAVIDLTEVTLAGGIGDIDILSQAVVPGATQMSFFVQIGGIWRALADDANAALIQAGVMQNLVPLRVVMTGTPEVMPILALAGSQVKVSRPDLTFTWFSAIRNLPGGGSSQIRATFRLENFNAVHHTLTAKLRTGAGYATETAPSSVSDAVQADGSIERTAVWNLGGAVTSYRLKLTGVTDNALLPFHVASRRDYAL